MSDLSKGQFVKKCTTHKTFHTFIDHSQQIYCYLDLFRQNFVRNFARYSEYSIKNPPIFLGGFYVFIVLVLKSYFTFKNLCNKSCQYANVNMSLASCEYFGSVATVST